ncbi:MAG: GNAT family N-acetyltransferase, partial [Actinomycetaceae bacterium]|nr:GNAT family N-acetyltransferase [Actinomycetaceae bacterium]
HDRKVLARSMFLVSDMNDRVYSYEINVATLNDVEALESIAFRTFPDACPHVSEKDQLAFMRDNLTSKHFAHYIQSDTADVFVARCLGEIVAYVLVDYNNKQNDDILPMLRHNEHRYVDGGPVAYLSKFYVDRPWRSSGVAYGLWCFIKTHIQEKIASRHSHVTMWLSTNAANKRAQKAYKKMGFSKVGTRHFMVGDTDNLDYIYATVIDVE